MATELALERHGKGDIGSFAETQDLIRSVFPETQFGWTTSGPEKLRLAAERGIAFPVVLREAMKTLPSLLEGRVVLGEDDQVEFGLGYTEPVQCLYVTPRGTGDDLEQKLSKLEAVVEGEFVISGEETNRH